MSIFRNGKTSTVICAYVLLAASCWQLACQLEKSPIVPIILLNAHTMCCQQWETSTSTIEFGRACVCPCACVCAFNCLMLNCPIAIAIHISQIMTRERYEFIQFCITRSQTLTHSLTRAHTNTLVHSQSKCEFYHDSYYIFHYCLWYLWEKRVRSNMK